MNQIQRSIFAFLIAPLVPVLMLSLFVLGVEKFMQALPLVGFFAYLITLFVAVPIYAFMVFKKWLNWWHFALLGVIPALSLDAWAFFMSLGSEGGMVTLRQGGVDIIVEGKRTIAGYIYLAKRMAFYSLTGVGAGLLFWFIAHSKSALTKSSSKDAASGAA